MSVAVGDVDTFMPHPVSDCQSRKAHVNQQGNVAVSEVVNPDTFDPRRFRSSVHLPVKIGFRHRENTVCRLCGIQALDVVLHFFTEESGHLNDPVALGGLGVGDYILALDTLIGF